MELIGLDKEKLEIFQIVALAVVTICRFIIKKLMPYLKTKIFVNKYSNFEPTMFLIEYELFGTLIAHLLTTVLVAVLGKESSWEKILLREYLGTLILFFIVYIAGVVYTIKLKMKGNKYKENVLFGIGIYVILSVPFLLMFRSDYNSELDFIFWVCVLVVSFGQLEENIVIEQIKRVKYKIYVKKKVYTSIYEPTKKGDDLFIKITDEQKSVIKIVQIPVKKVDKIEHVIKEINES